MGIITGGNVIGPGGAEQTPLSKLRIYWTTALPTDATVAGTWYAAANGDIAINVTNGNVYERQMAVWTRIDTI